MKPLLAVLGLAACSPAGSTFELDGYDTAFRGVPDPLQAPGPACTPDACDLHVLSSTGVVTGTEVAPAPEGGFWHTGAFSGLLSADGVETLQHSGGAPGVFLLPQAEDGTLGSPIDLSAGRAALLTGVGADVVVKLTNPSDPQITGVLPDSLHVLARITAAGDVVWVHDVPWNDGATLGGDGDVMALFLRDDGRLFAAGWMGTSGTLLGHDFVIDGMGQTWVGEIDVDTGTLVDAHAVGSIEVYGLHVDDGGTYTVTGAWGTGSGGAWGDRELPAGGNQRTAFVGQVASDGTALDAYDFLAATGGDQCTARRVIPAGEALAVVGDCNLSIGGGMPPEIRPLDLPPGGPYRQIWVARFEGAQLVRASQVGAFDFFTTAGLAVGPSDYVYATLGDTSIVAVTPDSLPYGVSRTGAYVRALVSDGSRAMVQLESNSTSNDLSWGTLRDDADASKLWVVGLDLPR